MRTMAGIKRSTMNDPVPSVIEVSHLCEDRYSLAVGFGKEAGDVEGEAKRDLNGRTK